MDRIRSLASAAVAAALALASPPASAAGQAGGAGAPLPAPHGLTSSLLGGASPAASHDGNVELSWQVDEVLQQALDAGAVSFTVEERSTHGTVELDAGPHLSTALSGRDDGTYRFRVRARRTDGVTSPWSEPIELQVEHHPLWLAGLMFSIGGLVFLATAALILAGHRRTRTAPERTA